MAVQFIMNLGSPKKSKDEIALAYRSEPWWYDVRGFFILTFAYNSTLGEQLRFFGPNFGVRHLEVACGTGTLLELIFYWRRWKKLPKVQVVGVDYAEPMLAGARHRFAGKPDLEFLHADVAEMPFPECSFDTANVANAVHCFPDVNGGLRGIIRVLKPDGTMAANVLLFPRGRWPLRHIAERINRWGMRKGILYTPYERDDIRQRIVAAGFEIVTEATSGNCYNVLARNPATR
jgi:ubiquinone/menaquinone biosynthesis C-methylase UbiE